ncbi:MAG: ABC-F family ATP-binding cassette domain-containing protein, partial [Lachnospiraceae bacterium]|nr:ABC-F family ATP-binding cassette domain-containing protein [Lachnospiraceae bacterium]
MILSCQNVSKAYGTEVILKDISFHIEKKEKLGIVGPNGSGKSTLLKIIAGEIEADSGLVVCPKGLTIG